MRLRTFQFEENKQSEAKYSTILYHTRLPKIKRAIQAISKTAMIKFTPRKLDLNELKSNLQFTEQMLNCKIYVGFVEIVFQAFPTQ